MIYLLLGIIFSTFLHLKIHEMNNKLVGSERMPFDTIGFVIMAIFWPFFLTITVLAFFYHGYKSL